MEIDLGKNHEKIVEVADAIADVFHGKEMPSAITGIGYFIGKLCLQYDEEPEAICDFISEVAKLYYDKKE